ncbi:MAG: hypothetical protein U9R60_13325 [Bacteroidota bacterium]|nr:hypothetical protein [Bacteroidota bacterium]
MLKRIIAFGSKYIDYKMAIAGAIVMAIIVFSVNYFKTSEMAGSLTAAIKQGVYTFFFGGFIMKTCERLSISIRKSFWAILLAIIIPSAIAITLTYIVHSLKGTPLPLESTIPTAILIIPATLWWSLRKRRKVISG